MKKNLIIIICCILAVVLVLLLFLFKGCGQGQESDGIYPDVPVRMYFVGGGIENSSLAQSIALFHLRPPKDEKFEVTVSGLPKDIETTNFEGAKDSYGYKHTVLALSKKGTIGKFPFKVTVKSKTVLEEFDGSVIVGPLDHGPDTLFGGCEKNGVIGDVNPVSLVFAGQGDLGATATSNLATSAGLVYAGNINGELFGFNQMAEKIFTIKAFDYPIETIQATENQIVASDILGNLSLFDVTKAKKGEQVPISTYKFGTKLSSPPTIIAKDRIVVANVDGSVSMLSIPQLKILWKQSAKGVVIGHVSIFAVKAGDERFATLNFSSGDNSSYILDEQGKLRTRIALNEFTKNGTSVCGTKRYFTAKNVLSCTDPSGHTMWERYLTELLSSWHIVSTPDLVFAFSDKSIFCRETKNGTEVWTQKLTTNVVSQPVLAGDVLIVPVENGLAHAYKVSSGLKLGEINFGSQITAWPICFGDMIVFADRIGKIIFLGRTQGTAPSGGFEMVLTSNGGFVDTSHNLYMPTCLPKNLRLLYELPGNYTKGITTKTHIFLYNVSDKYFVCIQAKTGKEVWRFSATAFEGAYSTTALSDCPMWLSRNGFYAATKQGLVVLDPKTGKVIGSTPFSGLPQSDDTVIALTDGNELVVLDKALKFLWKKDGVFFASGICIVGPEIFAFNRDKEGNSSLWIFDKLTGKVKFTEKDNTIGNGIQLNVSKNYVLCNTPYIWLLDRRNNEVFGASSQAPMGDTVAVFPNGRILYKGFGGIIFEFDPNTGRVKPLYEPKEEDAAKLGATSFGIFICDEIVQFFIDRSKEPKNVEDIKPEDMRFNIVLARTSITGGKPIVIGEFVQTKSLNMTLTVGDGILGMSYVGDDKTKLMVFGP